MKTAFVAIIISIFALTACENSTINSNIGKDTNTPNVVYGGGGCTTNDDAMESLISNIEQQLGFSLSDVQMKDKSLKCYFIACMENHYTNHGQFVSCISHLTNEMMKAKIITGKQKSIIVGLAANSEIGKK